MMRDALRNRHRDDAGFSLIEVLVTLGILSIVSAATLSVMLGVFRAQRTSDDVRDKIDRTRLAVERIREGIRDADEVCVASTATTLRVWRDDDTDDVVDADETFAYRVVGPAGDHRLEHVDSTGTRVLVRDVGDPAVTPPFTYDIAPADQDTSALCGVPTGTFDRRTSVVTVELAAASQSEMSGHVDDLVVSSSIMLRNAIERTFTTASAPAAGGNQAPTAAMVSPSCSGMTCSFDVVATDPDGSIVAYEWFFGDGGTATTQAPNHTYAAEGTYTVTVTVTDDEGAVASDAQTLIVSLGGSSFTMHVGDLDDASEDLGGNKWKPGARILVHDDSEGAVSGVTVTAKVHETLTTCVTDSTGWCTVRGVELQSGNNKVNQVFIEVTQLSRSGWTHDPAVSHNPDGDNGGNEHISVDAP